MRLTKAWHRDAVLYLLSLGGAVAVFAVVAAVWFYPWELAPPDSALRPGLGLEFYQGTHFQPEPGERAAFLIGIVAAPLAMLGLALVLLRWRLSPQTSVEIAAAGFVTVVCGLIAGLAGCFADANAINLFFIRVPVLWCGLVIVAVLAAKSWNSHSSKSHHWLSHLAALALAALLVYLASFELFRGDFDHFAQLHNEPVVYPVTQVCAGKTLLVDARSLYGLYPHFLEPLFYWQGLSAESFGRVMTGLLAASTLGVLWSLRTLTHRMGLVLLGGLAYFFFPHYALNGVYSYPYWQYYPLRTMFPCLCVALGTWYCARPTRSRWWALLVVTGCAPLWNLDSGVFTVASVCVLLGCARLMSLQRTEPLPWRSAVLAGCAPLASCLVCALAMGLMLAVRSGKLPDFGQAVHYQKVFYRDGFAMEPMPVVGLWWIPAGIYLAGGSLAIRDVLQRRKDWRSAVVAQCVVLGVGLFTYYQGRSVYTNLCLCSWPIAVLLTVFVDRLWTSLLPASRERFGGEGVGRILSLQRLGWFCFCVFGLTQLAGTAIATNSLLVFTAEYHYPSDPEASYSAPWRQRTELVRTHLAPEQLQQGLLVLSSQDHAWHLALGSRSPTRNAGFNHLFYQRDLDEYFQLLKSASCEYVLWDDAWLKPYYQEHQVGFISEPERERLRAALEANYQLVGQTGVSLPGGPEEVLLFRRGK